MESRWYLAPGQTIDNTTISQRGHALHVTATEWQKIRSHLDRNRLVAEALEKEKAHKQALKEGSESMTRNWPNCVLNTQRQKEEEKARLDDELEDRKMTHYLEIRKEQDEMRRAYIEKVKRSMYFEKSYPKRLNGALLESEAIYERQKQLEFKKTIAEHDREVERLYAEKVKKGVEEERQEKLEKQKADAKKKIELKEMFLKEISDKKEFEKNYIAKKIRNELKDNENAKMEMEQQQTIKKEDEFARRVQMKKELLEYMAKDDEIKKQMQKEEREVDEVIHVFEQAKFEISCLRKQKEEEIKQQMVQRREAASKKAVAEKQAKDDEFARILKKAQDEVEQQEENQRQAKLEKIRQMRQDREEDRKQFLERQAKEKADQQEMQKWEMLNTQKKSEVMREYEKDAKRKSWQKKLLYRQELLEQMQENEMSNENAAELAAKEDAYMRSKLEREDKAFFDYANELLEYAKRTGRPTRPIENVIIKYKKNNNFQIESSHRCEDIMCERRGKMVNTTPGKMAHDKCTDPNYNRKCRLEKIVE